MPTFNKEGITKVGSVQDRGEGLEPGRNYDNNNTLTKRIFKMIVMQFLMNIWDISYQDRSR